MKIDKDALIKHRFWILVGLSVPLAAIAILLLTTSVSSGIAEARKKLTDTLKTLKNVKEAKRPAEIEGRKYEADILVGKETEVWAKAYREQEPLFVWSRAMEEQYHFADGFFATEVQIIKDPGKKEEWPADKTFERATTDGALLHHGKLQSANESQFTIVDREGKSMVFRLTPKLRSAGFKVQEEGGGGGEPEGFSKLSDAKYAGKLVAVAHQKARYFNEPLTVEERLFFAQTYHRQIPPLVQIVDPLHRVQGDDGKERFAGVVQFKGGWMINPAADDKKYDKRMETNKDQLVPPEGSKFLRCRYAEWNEKGDISTEAWIAQEDLWVQMEIYRIIRAANDSLGQFAPTDPKKKALKPDEMHGKPGETVAYANSYFELTAKLRDDKSAVEVTIANRLDRRQKIDFMQLRLRTSAKGAAEVVTIKGDPLDPRSKGEKRQLVLKLDPNQQRDGLYGVEQVLTWETAAVKRIDHVAIGSNSGDDVAFSHREMQGLRGYVKVEVAAKPDESSSSGPGGAGGPGPGAGGSSKFGSGAGLDKGAGAGAGDAKKGDNGFATDRYKEVTEQFRRIPVAVVVIADQNHVDRVLNAFNNSKLRFLMTQSMINHYPQSLKPQAQASSDKPSDKSGGSGPKVPGGPMGSGPMGGGPMGGGSGSFGFKPGLGLGGPGAAGSNPTTPSALQADNMEANMELVIYGVVTLYERYPPLPRAGAAAAKTP